MGPKSSIRSSKSSLVSVDPAIASHITGTSKATSTTGHTRTGSSPAQTTSTSATATSKSHGRTNSTPVRHKSKRSNSLRRAKNSTELLKAKTASVDKKEKQTERVDVNKGRNFTITNVGTGGMLHLRPSPHQTQILPAVSPPSSTQPWTAPVATSVLPLQSDTSLPSRSNTLRTRSASPRRLIDNASQPSNASGSRKRHIRSQSFSTLRESRKSQSSTSKPRTLKIVINRPVSPQNGQAKKEPPSLRTLAIPIPHYKIGTPRFSAHGTPMLRSSGYTRSSAAGSAFEGSGTGNSLQPPPAGTKAFSRLHQLMPPGQQSHMGFNFNQSARSEFVRRSMESIEPPSPVSPRLFDDLTEVYNDPSVVRYSQSIREITAATKARIIAQISSDSFMDYELVSDFFLTFRSYMSTYEVLDLLLARLEWALGRLSDDGRIVRIRTFAALRHWILNYFVDDFVINRRLRVRFCEGVNELYEDVNSRPKGYGAASDLKILQDLKRCWNGRCSLYWDAEEFSMDADQESPLLPGGVLGSRNPTFTDMNELNAASGGNLLNSSQPVPSPLLPGSPKKTRKTKHKHLPSSGSAKKRASVVDSESSIQAGSCSIPRSKSRSPDEPSLTIKGPHPVSVLSRRQNAPSDLKVVTNGRKQSPRDAGKSVDTSGEPTPVAVPKTEEQWSDPHEGSIIRGFVYGPVEPFVHLPSRPALSPSMTLTVEEHRDPAQQGIQGQHGAHGPTVKNVIGSIRRALSGKQGSNEVALITVSTPRPTNSLRGRRSTVPVNLARSNGDLRKKATGADGQAHVRIDLLCAAAVQSFQAVVSAPEAQTAPVILDPASTIGVALSPPLSHPEENRNLLRPDRMASHYTSQSGSILIVDDTATDMPVMSGALDHSYTHGSEQSLYSDLPIGELGYGGNESFETQVPYRDSDALDEPERKQKFSSTLHTGGPRAQTSASTMGKVQSGTGSTATIRNHPSSPRDGSTGQKLSEDDIEEPISAVTDSDEKDTTSRGSTRDPLLPPPALRRRPGGDLRGNRNVQDLEFTAHHESLDSMLHSQSSAPDSLLMMTDAPPATTTTSLPPTTGRKAQRVSMINTHSSQHLRPSFEAAVAGFSSIPDDDDGGLEATLLKLEGRYDGRSPDLSNPSGSPPTVSDIVSTDVPALSSTASASDQDTIIDRGYHRTDPDAFQEEFFLQEEQFADTPEPLRYAQQPMAISPDIPAKRHQPSRESDNSTPLLRRATARPVTEPFHNVQQPIHMRGKSENEFHRRFPAPSLPRSPQPQNLPRPETAHTEGGRSFLLDEDENLSELSSEISVDIIDYSEALGDAGSPMLAAPGTAIAGLEIPSHPLAHASLVNLSIQPSPELHTGSGAGNAPLTPETSPILLQAANGEPVAIGKPFQNTTRGVTQGATQISAGPAHVPFILACDSQVLAQQMTIVEQSALTEIEWTDLVEMRWSKRPKTVLDWAEYMANDDDPKGIDLVISRTNLVIKWALSEIVLTQDINERARVLSKFIHVAAHARRLHNYATMLQITVALVSNDCANLKKTWELVPGPDKSLLKNMEPLVNPSRNFQDLRVEMESAELADGCVPFIGLYTHDLTLNASKPAEIEVGDDLEPLVNFERFRAAASIIKGLLRLIDASSKYDFDPVHGIIERCLWMSALSDDRIHTLSKTLE